jgi:hypothetical protein
VLLVQPDVPEEDSVLLADNLNLRLQVLAPVQLSKDKCFSLFPVALESFVGFLLVLLTEAAIFATHSLP